MALLLFPPSGRLVALLPLLLDIPKLLLDLANRLLITGILTDIVTVVRKLAYQ
jgi:hypothetical protein